MTNPKDMFCNN